MNHVDTWLPELAFGTLPAPRRAEVEAHLGSCDLCATGFSVLTEALCALPFALAPEAPAMQVRARLLAAVEKDLVRPIAPERSKLLLPPPPARPEPVGGSPRAGIGAPLLQRLAVFFDLATDRVREILRAIDDPSAWVPGLPGIAFLHLEAGPALAGADSGLVRMAPDVLFPRHRHLGEERVVILQGGVRDGDGTVMERGDERTMPAGSQHHFVALSGAECIFAVNVYDGIEMIFG